MIIIDAFRKFALSLPEATEEPHFEKTSFRVKKKIFVSIRQTTSFAKANLLLNLCHEKTDRKQYA